MKGGIKSIELDLDNFMIVTTIANNIKIKGKVNEGFVKPIFNLKKSK